MENPKDSTRHTLKDFAYRQGDLFLETCLALKNKGENVFLDSHFSEIVKGLQQLMTATSDDDIVGPPPTTNYFQQLQAAISDGTAQAKFPIGTIFPDTWTDHKNGANYSIPHIIVHYGEVLLEHGQKAFGAVLLRIYVIPRQIYFNEEKWSFYPESDCRRFIDGDYERGCSRELMEVTAKTMISVETSYDTTGYMPARFFPPTLENLHFDPYDNPDLEKLVWDYFRDEPTNINARNYRRTFCHPVTYLPESCWLRSTLRSDPSLIWRVYKNGEASFGGTGRKDYVAPACIIIGKPPANVAPAATSVTTESSPSLAPA